MQNHHGGYSNPFGVSQNQNMNQGYTGFQSFVPNQQQQQPYTQPPQAQQQNPNMIKPKQSIHQSKIVPSNDKNPQKRLFKGKYELNAPIPIKFNTVDYFMLVENVRINNENALRELKRGKACNVLNTILDSLEFLSYIHK